MENFVRELVEKERHLGEEVASLRKAAGDREKDLDTLNMVLQCNQDIIDVISFLNSMRKIYLYPKVSLFKLCPLYCPFSFQDLRVALGEKQRLLLEMEKEREVWRQRGRALAATMHEKEEVVRVLKVELESCMKDVQVQMDKKLLIYFFPIFDLILLVSILI